MHWLFGGFQIINLIIMIGLIGLWIYVSILLIKFLQTGTRAFQKYLEKNDDRRD
ncbi:hypothetical protein QBE53_06415 [Vallitaleaceae bacterium 9-2]